MNRVIAIGIIFFLGLFFNTASFVLAHGSHRFHSLEEFTEHLESHTAEGKNARAQKPIPSSHNASSYENPGLRLQQQ